MSSFSRLSRFVVGAAVLALCPSIEGIAPVAQAPPAVPGLVSWWLASNTRDVAGANHGFFRNGAATGEGRIGKGFHFDGIDDDVMVPYDPSLDLGDQGSLVFWMRADPGNPLKCAPACQGLVTTDYFMVEISPFGPDGGVNFVVATTTGGDPMFRHTSDGNAGTGATVTAGEWHHIAGTYDGTKLQLYVDGQPWGNPTFGTGTIAPMESGSFLAIGSEEGRLSCPGCSGRYFHGDIDEVAIYGRALSTAEVQGLFRRAGNR